MHRTIFAPAAGIVSRRLALYGLALGIYYVLAVDQGFLLSLLQGQMAFDQNFIHELVHDARHAAGFPCH